VGQLSGFGFGLGVAAGGWCYPGMIFVEQWFWWKPATVMGS